MNFIQWFLIVSFAFSFILVVRNRKDIKSYRQSFPFIGVGLTTLLLLLAYYLLLNIIDMSYLVDELLLNNPNSWVVRKLIFLSYLLIFIGLLIQFISLSNKIFRDRHGGERKNRGTSIKL